MSTTCLLVNNWQGVLVCISVGLAVMAADAQPSDSAATDAANKKRISIGIGDSQLETMPAPAGLQSVGGVTTAPSVEAATPAAGSRKGEFILAPLPIASEAIGVGLAPVVAYVFYPSGTDKVSPPSTLALAGVYTSTKTYGLGIGGLFNLEEDHFRFTFLVGSANARYEFFGIGNSAGQGGESVWLRQDGHAIFLQGIRKVGGHVFVGPRFAYRNIKEENTTENQAGAAPPLTPIADQLDVSLTTSAFGIRIERDTRDSMFYPTRGQRLDARIDFFGPYVGSDFTFQSYAFELNKYLPAGQRHVVALRAMGCGVSGERIPFYELCQFGAQGDLRGYQTGRYRDRAMFAAQAEWRVILPWRFGGTVFGGVGEVAPDGGSFTMDNLLPSGGIGLRFNLSKQRRINLRVDLAYSRTGGSWSMGVAEVF